MKLVAVSNGNLYQTDDPNLTYPTYLPVGEAEVLVAGGVLVVKAEPEVDPQRKRTRKYKRRDLEPEETAEESAEEETDDEPDEEPDDEPAEKPR